MYVFALAVGVLFAMSSSLLALSTSSDGLFQAIAQAPDRINVYWKADKPVSLIVDGLPRTDLAGSVDPVTGFTVATINGLEPNSVHTFRLDPDGLEISEKTWQSVSQAANFDVLVIGGSASGVAAAITIARLGLSVGLVEETNRLGGMAANGLGSTDIRKPSRSNGLFEDFRRRAADFYGEGNGLRYEPRVANAIIKQMVYENERIYPFLYSKVQSPIMLGNQLKGAVVRDMNTGVCGHFTARVVIDATDAGDFAAACGAKFMAGREARSKAEPHAGVIYFDDATQQILPGSTGKADNRQQSYAYLMIWKNYGDAGARLIEKPDHYDPANYANSPDWPESWGATSGKLPNDKFEINQHPFGTDWPGINYDYPIANEARRREIALLYRDRALGYLYYMQNERGHKNLGLADDEFLDNGNFPTSLYVREARRIAGNCLFKENDVSDARQFNRFDSIAIGDYPMDSHATEDLKDPEAPHKGEGEEWLASFTPWYQAPYYVLVPEKIDGLLVSTAVSATHVGYGTLRMEPVRMSLGQAAGAAAYWSVIFGRPVRDINPAWIQDKILSQHSYINWNSDVTRDTRHFKAINFLTARGFFPGEEFRPDDNLTAHDAHNALSLMVRLEGCATGLPITPVADTDEPITRGVFAQWLVVAKQLTSSWWGWMTPPNPSYTDVPAGSPYYAAVETLRAHCIEPVLFADYEEHLFKPDAPITRADAAEAIFLAHRTNAMGFWK